MQEEFGKDPYKLLVAVMLSARSKDEVTIPTAKKLFVLAGNPSGMVKLPRKEIEKILKPIGFFRSKAKYVQELSQQLIDEFEGKVPEKREELVKLAGVGRKTANVVLAQYFNQDVIAVDTHVHRISNRLGWVRTRKPEETEAKLYDLVPRKYWKNINHTLVRHGQEICKPILPMCSNCPVIKYCPKIGVKKWR